MGRTKHPEDGTSTAPADAVRGADACDRDVTDAPTQCEAQAVPFRAALDLTELDERGRPGSTWAARACELSRSHLTFRSRRMCYSGRTLLAAVHLIDDRPVPLYGEVAQCDYDGDGLYRTKIALQQMPGDEACRDWMRARDARGSF